MVFGEFLKAAPSIAQDVHSWCESDDKLYDAISRSASGLTTKWQITEWLDPEQTRGSKERQRLEHAIDDAVRDLRLPDATTCGLFLQDPPTHFRHKHVEPFRTELLALAEDVAAQAKLVPHPRYTWQRKDECWVLQSDISAWPVLVRYLRKVRFGHGEARSVISVMGFASSFCEQDAVDQLISCIEKKMRNYHWPTGDDVRLLVFYSDGWIYNSPICAPLVRNAEIAAEYLRGVQVPFDHVYLIFGRSGEAYELHPDLNRCT